MDGGLCFLVGGVDLGRRRLLKLDGCVDFFVVSRVVLLILPF